MPCSREGKHVVPGPVGVATTWQPGGDLKSKPAASTAPASVPSSSSQIRSSGKQPFGANEPQIGFPWSVGATAVPSEASMGALASGEASGANVMVTTTGVAPPPSTLELQPSERTGAEATSPMKVAKRESNEAKGVNCCRRRLRGEAPNGRGIHEPCRPRIVAGSTEDRQDRVQERREGRRSPAATLILLSWTALGRAGRRATVRTPTTRVCSGPGQGQGASTSRTAALPAASKARTATMCGAPRPATGISGVRSASTASSAVSKIPSAGASGRHSTRPSTATSTRAIGPTPSTTSARSRRPVSAIDLKTGGVLSTRTGALSSAWWVDVAGRVRQLVARVDPHAVLALGERGRVPLELGLGEDVVRRRRVEPPRLALAPELHAVAELVAVGVVDLPRHVNDVVVLGRLAAARGQPLLRLFRGALLVGLDLGHDGAEVLGHERQGHVGDRGRRVAQPRAHLHVAPRGARHGASLGDGSLPGAPRRVGDAGVARARRDLERSRAVPREVTEARPQPRVERLARPHRVRAADREDAVEDRRIAPHDEARLAGDADGARPAARRCRPRA